MTVEELINELSKYPPHLKVGGAWEGIIVEVGEVGTDGEIVWLDVDNALNKQL